VVDFPVVTVAVVSMFELSHDMLKLKIHIHEILNNNFRLEFPKLNT
jgi:hypothetical protein